MDPDSVDVAALVKEAAGNERHFCEECAYKYFASTPGMNSSRTLICLSDAYRRRLLVNVEAELPDAFYLGEDPKRAAGRSERDFVSCWPSKFSLKEIVWNGQSCT